MAGARPIDQAPTDIDGSDGKEVFPVPPRSYVWNKNSNAGVLDKITRIDGLTDATTSEEAPGDSS